MTTMSITRGLVELKRLSDRISTATNTGKFVSRTVGKNIFKKVHGSNESVESMTSKIIGSFDQVDSLIANRAKIKSAIVMSNATTKVVILNNEISVAEAIELKSSVALRKDFLTTLRIQFMSETKEVDKINATLDASIDVSLNAIYGSEKSKISEDTYKSVAGPQKEQKEAALLDPCKIDERIAKLVDEIANIESELDFVLSESNARTLIKV